MEVEPTSRGHAHSKLLFHAVMKRALKDGCVFGVACSRIPSYAGSAPTFPQERFACNQRFRAAIDRYLEQGVYPSLEELLLDPLLAHYYRLGSPAKCQFHWIIPDFAPYDIAAGGIRVVIFGKVNNWQPEVAAG